TPDESRLGQDGSHVRPPPGKASTDRLARRPQSVRLAGSARHRTAEASGEARETDYVTSERPRHVGGRLWAAQAGAIPYRLVIRFGRPTPPSSTSTHWPFILITGVPTGVPARLPSTRNPKSAPETTVGVTGVTCSDCA